MEWLRWLRLTGIVALILAVYLVAPVDLQVHGGAVLRAVVALLVLIATAAALVVQVRLALSDAERRVDGLVAAIVAAVVVFAFAFYVLELRNPGEVTGLDTRVDALYFATSTMLTVGYGDIHATGQAARTLVLVQMVFDVVFVATAASLLTSHVRKRAASRVPTADSVGPGQAGESR